MQKNVILITIDSLRRDSVGFLNPNCKLTPYLDKLATKSTLMANAFAAGGGTIYAMSSLMTSSFPIISLNDRTIRGWPTLAESFRRRGYRTAAFHSNAWLSRPFGFDQGFDDFHYIVPPLEHVVPLDSPSRRISQALNEFTSITIRDAPLWLRAFQLFEQASGWVNKLDRRQSYFLWIHVMDTHFPYNYPTTAVKRLNPNRIFRYGFDFLARYSKNSLIKTAGKNFSLIKEYNASVQYVDTILQDFCEKFSDASVVIMADHGDLFGEHGYFQHPGNLYNEIIRIPVLVYDRNNKREVIRSNFSAIETGDLLSSLSAGNESSIFEPKIHQMFSIHLDYNTNVRRTSIVDGRWKLMVTENIVTKTTVSALYDIQKDPAELQDRSQENHDIVQNLMRDRMNIMKSSEKVKFKLSVRRMAPMLQRKSINQQAV